MIRKLSIQIRKFSQLESSQKGTYNSTLFPIKTLEENSDVHNVPVSKDYLLTLRVPPAEIEARIFKVAMMFPKIDMNKFNLDMKFNDLGIDSLETIAVICTLEDEFHCVFEETVFDNFTCGRDVLNHLTRNDFFF